MFVWIGWFLVVMLLFGLHTFKEDYIVSHYKKDFFYACLIAFSIIFAGLRYQIGNDYDSYVEIYRQVSVEPLSTYVEPGFAYICHFLSLLGVTYQGMFFLFSALTILFIAPTLKRYSVNPIFSFLLLLLIPNYYFSILSAVRQYFAISIVFLSLPYIVEKKFFKFLFCVIVAAFFHKTVLIMLPFYFLAHLNYSKNLLIAALAFVSLYPITKFLEGNILITDYEDYLHSKAPEFSLGISLLVRVALFFITLSIRDKFESTADKVIINLYLLGMIFYFATLSTEALSRISLYLTIFEIIATVNVFYLFIRSDRIQLSSLYLLYLSVMFFKLVVVYGTKYVPGTSLGNINYTLNFKLFE